MDTAPPSSDATKLRKPRKLKKGSKTKPSEELGNFSFQHFLGFKGLPEDFFSHQPFKSFLAVLMLVSHSDFSASSAYLKEPVPIPPDSSVGRPKKRKVKALNTGDQEAKHQRCDDTTAKAG